MEAKPWYQSRTIWINAAVVVLGLVMYVLNGVQTGEVALDLDADTVAMLMGIIGIVLRSLTNRAVRR